ncbi:hypothetical protein QTH90_31160 [Variovorax sp. J2P1-59]|uniref:hypothetical protein n=1 Tax=Variovorax flavidus TaxID=3053501 RepID=UPI00257786E3|nr:hypothetical protein [Variovorax sp. J2P1-59]MDM0078901.1 hypothetical protein [Variovorax sp. J2P1-59]
MAIGLAAPFLLAPIGMASRTEPLAFIFPAFVILALSLGPMALLYGATRLYPRSWFSLACCAIAILFAMPLCLLAVVKHGAMGVQVVLMAEAVVATAVLLAALTFRAFGNAAGHSL